MVNAQEWLDENYPKEQRNTVKELDINYKNLEGFLDLSDFVNLKILYCYHNKITSLNLTNCSNLQTISCWYNQLAEIKLPKGKKLEILSLLSLGNNNFNQDLSFLKDLVNLKWLRLDNNNFYGSLEPLRKNRQLSYLDIQNTEINDGLEYLPDSLTEFCCNNLWAKLLRGYKNGGYISYNYQAWRKDNLYLINKLEAKDKEIASLHSRLDDKNQEINTLQTQLSGNQTIIKNLQNELNNTQTELSETNSQLNQTINQLNNANNQLAAWKTHFFWPQPTLNQPDSVVTFRTQLNSFDLAGTAGLCLLARHLYRKYKQRQVPPQDEERQPLLRTPEEVTRLNQETRHLKSELNQIAKIVSPSQELSPDNLKQEITRLKYQELAPRAREAKTSFEQLLTEIRNKTGGLEKTINLLLETNQQKEQTTETAQKNKLNNKIEAYQNVLENTLTSEELQNLLNKQTELQQLEKHLLSLQQNQDQQPQIVQQQPFGMPGSSK